MCIYQGFSCYNLSELKHSRSTKQDDLTICQRLDFHYIQHRETIMNDFIDAMTLQPGASVSESVSQ